MTTPPWVSILEYIKNGEPVDASTDNRVLKQLAQRTDYLKALVDITSSANGIFDISAPVAPDVQEGFAVYWNAVTLRYENALAALDSTVSGTYGNIADSAFCLGICVSKSGPVRGSIMYEGRAEGVDFSNSVEGGAVVPGPYYLSSTDPGKLVKEKPPVGIYVMFGMQSSGSTGTAYIAPTPREVLEDHIHYSLELEYGNTIGNPGWTTSFDPGLAPAGAIYRYTVEADTPIDNLFPFFPSNTVYFEIDGIGSDPKVTIDMNGIWWIDSVHEPDEYEHMVIHYAKMVSKTNNTMVTSLQPYQTGPLSFVNCNGEPAIAGDLYAKLDLALRQGGDETEGYLAFKELTGDQQFVRGPIVESVRSASPEIIVSIDGSGETDADGRNYGRLVFSYNDPNNLNRELEPTLTSLDNATQEDYNGVIPYVGFPMAIESSVSYRFDVPTNLTGQYKFFFSSWVFASIGGVLPALTCNYVVVKKALNSALKNMSGNVTGSGALNIPIVNVNSNDYVLAAFLPGVGITLDAGDEVHIKITRASGTSYGGTVGILRAFASLEKVI